MTVPRQEGRATRVAELDARPATLDDARPVADILTAIDPDDPTDPEIQRYQWKTAPPWPRHRFALESGGKLVGLAYQAHAPWEEMPVNEELGYKQFGAGIQFLKPA